MKTSLLAALFFTGIANTAAASVPTVTCLLDYSTSLPDGVLGKYVPGNPVRITEQGVQSSNNGFTLDGSLQQICASDSAHCIDAYNLSVTIKRGDAASLIYTTVSSQDPNTSITTQLSVRTESGNANCYVNFPN